MKKIIFGLLLVACSCNIANAQKENGVGVRMWPVNDPMTAKLDLIKFSPSDSNIIRHYGSDGKIDLYVEKTTTGGLWIVTFIANGEGKQIPAAKVYLAHVSQKDPVWYTDGQHLKEENGKDVADNKYVPDIIKKTAKILKL
ncbi:MAG: hypothetical protein JWM20_100 [Patescibacteria group bacterium]|nr:hypothetical protein [Patescibacteria group bacterium]